MITIHDVAKVAGCSSATVSLVINGSNRRISQGTRSRVMTTIRDLGYQPTVSKVTDLSKKTRTLGVLYAGSAELPLDNLYFRPIVDGLFASVQAHNYSVLFFARTDWGNILSSLRQHFDGRCDGLVLVGPHEVDSFITTVKDRGIVIGVLGASANDSRVSSVNVDDNAGVTMGVRYLYERGHRRIAFFTGNDLYETSVARLDAYRNAIRDLALDAELCPIIAGDYCWSSGWDRAKFIATAIPRLHWPTAVFCCGDATALGALEGFASEGVAVPGDISVMGFDGLPNAAVSNPPLTTVSQGLEDMGRQVSDIVIAQVQNPDAPVQKIVRQPSIVERSSVRDVG